MANNGSREVWTLGCRVHVFVYYCLFLLDYCMSIDGSYTVCVCAYTTPLDTHTHSTFKATYDTACWCNQGGCNSVVCSQKWGPGIAQREKLVLPTTGRYWLPLLRGYMCIKGHGVTHRSNYYMSSLPGG